jgi:hypothetical protein
MPDLPVVPKCRTHPPCAVGQITTMLSRAHEAAGALGTRHSPRPPIFEGRHISGIARALGVARHENMSAIARSGAALSTVIVRLDRTIQYSRGVSDGIDKPRRTGSPACAGDDGGVWSKCDETIHASDLPHHGLLRCARNDDASTNIGCLTIESITRVGGTAREPLRLLTAIRRKPARRQGVAEVRMLRWRTAARRPPITTVPTMKRNAAATMAGLMFSRMEENICRASVN